MGISCFKLALLISYLRLVQDTSFRVYRMVVWLAFAFVFLAHLGCTLSLIFACQPVSRDPALADTLPQRDMLTTAQVQKSWQPTLPGTCIPDGPSFTGYAVVTIVSDIMVALLPIPVLLKINISRQKKLGLIGIFALGLFTTICSIMRYLQINEIQYGDHDSTMLVVWGVIEFNVGVSASSPQFCIQLANDILEHDFISALPGACVYAQGQGVPHRAIEVRLRLQPGQQPQHRRPITRARVHQEQKGCICLIIKPYFIEDRRCQ